MLVKLYFKLNWILGLGGSGGCLMTSITFDLTECSFTYFVASSGFILNKESSQHGASVENTAERIQIPIMSSLNVIQKELHPVDNHRNIDLFIVIKLNMELYTRVCIQMNTY